jgi:hypothetical protein
MLAGAMNTLNSETERLSREADKIKNEIHRLDRSIADKKIAREKLCGRYILRQIAFFKLNLHYPAPGQIIPLRPNKRYRNERVPEAMLISQR